MTTIFIFSARRVVTTLAKKYSFLVNAHKLFTKVCFIYLIGKLIILLRRKSVKKLCSQLFQQKNNLLHYGLNPLFEKTKEKVCQENRKWTFLKCPK